MKKHFLLFILGVLLISDAYPSEEIEATTLSQDNIVSYIQNFKETMSGYVYGQHKELSVKAREAVKNALEDFLVTFANDLKTTVEKNENEPLDIEKIEDGLPNENFQQIKKRIINEFPDVTDEMAAEIVFKLRKNLYVTKQRLDQIIRDATVTMQSRRAAEV